MPLYVNTNIQSLIAQNSLTQVNQSLQQNQERLSTGLRINSAADDAAGLAIATNFTAEIRGMNQAVRNANDGISFAQTAEGATEEITGNLQRMRELAVQSANGLYATGDGQGRPELQDEFVQLRQEITRVANNTTFNDGQILRGTAGGFSAAVDFQVGAGTAGNDQITLSLGDGDMTAKSAGLDLTSASIETQTGAQAAIGTIDTALNTVNTFRSKLGAIQNRLDSTMANLNNNVENVTEARSRLQDADIAKESAELTQNNVLRQAASSMLAQANQNPQLALQLLGGA